MTNRERAQRIVEDVCKRGYAPDHGTEPWEDAITEALDEMPRTYEEGGHKYVVLGEGVWSYGTHEPFTAVAKVVDVQLLPTEKVRHFFQPKRRPEEAPRLTRKETSNWLK